VRAVKPWLATLLLGMTGAWVVGLFLMQAEVFLTDWNPATVTVPIARVFGVVGLVWMWRIYDRFYALDEFSR
jgi:hypothetical protein